MLRRGLIFIVSVVAWLLVATQVMPGVKASMRGPTTAEIYSGCSSGRYLSAVGFEVTPSTCAAYGFHAAPQDPSTMPFAYMYNSPWGRPVTLGPQAQVNPWTVSNYPTAYPRSPFGAWSAGGYSPTSPMAAEINALYGAPTVGYGSWY